MTPRFLRVVAGMVLLCGTSLGPRAAAALEITVEAGPFERLGTLVSFPCDAPRGHWELRGDDGRRLPVQFEQGTAWFVEPHLAAHSTRHYRLVPRHLRFWTGGRLRVQADGQAREFRLNGRPVFTYLAGPGQLPRPEIPEPYRRGGYLHPVRTPAGRVVTDDYPAIHLHHHGLWFSWCRTVFQGRTPDFWNMGEKKGRTDFVAVDDLTVGPVFAALRTRHAFTDVLAAPPIQALEETWTVRLSAMGADARAHVFDLESEQRCATDAPLKLVKYIYGGLAYRGPAAWNGTNALRYLDANGVTDRLAANESRARWHWMGGQVDGHLAGLATLGHPDNFRAPQPLRIHPQEPYSCWAPSQLGDWEIQPGETYRSRYRVVALDGEPDPQLLDRLWNDFALPPVVRVTTGRP